MARQVIHGLQVFRGLAALAVVAHHTALSTDAFVAAMPAALSRVFGLGAFGVDFFFVLSGFIIMHAHLHEAGRPERMGAYLFKRLTQIFPAYWPIGLALVGLYAALPTLSASGGREFSYVSSLLLLPADRPPALSVAWTLVHELMFYAVFLLWFVSRRVFWAGLLVWVTCIAVAYGSDFDAGWQRYPLGLLNIEFMLGVFAARLYRQGALARRAGMLIAGGGMPRTGRVGAAVWRAGAPGSPLVAGVGPGRRHAGRCHSGTPATTDLAPAAAGAGQCQLLHLPGAQPLAVVHATLGGAV